MLFIFTSEGYHVHCSGTILAILVKEHKRNISMNFFLRSSNRPRRCCLKIFLYF